MPSLANWSKPLEGARARCDANVELHVGAGEAGFRMVHAFGACASFDSNSGWSSNYTKCSKKFKHHDREKNRRVDKAVSCLACLMEE